MLAEQSNLSAHSVELEHDLDYFAPHRIEERNRRLAVNNFFRIADNYRVGKVSLRSHILFRGCVADLVFRADPSAVQDGVASGVAFPHGGPTKSHRDEDGVLLDIRHVVYGPEGVIPSLVRLVPFKDRDDFGREKLFRAIYPVGPMREIAGEGEVVSVLRGAKVLLSDGVSGLIQTGAQIVDGIERNAGDVIREGFAEDVTVRLRSVRIILNKVGVWLSGADNLDLGFEILDMMICATE